jgi:fructosamine-3-kinase
LSRDAFVAGALDAALAAAGLPRKTVARRPLAGGCIFQAEVITLADGREVVAKFGAQADAPLFREEAVGLRALHDTGTVRVPEPLGVGEVGGAAPGGAVLVMRYVVPGRADAAAWAAFGRELAALHATDVGSRYGFHTDNHLGATLQPNGWTHDWVRFTAERRLQHQARLARGRGLLEPSEARRIDVLCGCLDDHLPRRPRPALLHGDLWSGNALPAADGRVAVIDPAVHVGDGWADIAMMRLFGGFPEVCFDAYREAAGDPGNTATRIVVYQLYHLLNHVNLFGRGYAGQAMSLLSRLGC